MKNFPNTVENTAVTEGILGTKENVAMADLKEGLTNDVARKVDDKLTKLDAGTTRAAIKAEVETNVTRDGGKTSGSVYRAPAETPNTNNTETVALTSTDQYRQDIQSYMATYVQDAKKILHEDLTEASFKKKCKLLGIKTKEEKAYRETIKRLKQEEKAMDLDMQALLTKSREGKQVLSDQYSGNSFLQKITAWHDEIAKIDSALTFGNIPKSQGEFKPSGVMVSPEGLLVDATGTEVKLPTASCTAQGPSVRTARNSTVDKQVVPLLKEYGFNPQGARITGAAMKLAGIGLTVYGGWKVLKGGFDAIFASDAAASKKARGSIFKRGAVVGALNFVDPAKVMNIAKNTFGDVRGKEGFGGFGGGGFDGGGAGGEFTSTSAIKERITGLKKEDLTTTPTLKTEILEKDAPLMVGSIFCDMTPKEIYDEKLLVFTPGGKVSGIDFVKTRDYIIKKYDKNTTNRNLFLTELNMAEKTTRHLESLGVKEFVFNGFLAMGFEDEKVYQQDRGDKKLVESMVTANMGKKISSELINLVKMEELLLRMGLKSYFIPDKENEFNKLRSQIVRLPEKIIQELYAGNMQMKIVEKEGKKYIEMNARGGKTYMDLRDTQKVFFETTSGLKPFDHSFQNYADMIQFSAGMLYVKQKVGNTLDNVNFQKKGWLWKDLTTTPDKNGNTQKVFAMNDEYLPAKFDEAIYSDDMIDFLRNDLKGDFQKIYPDIHNILPKLATATQYKETTKNTISSTINGLLQTNAITSAIDIRYDVLPGSVPPRSVLFLDAYKDANNSTGTYLDIVEPTGTQTETVIKVGNIHAGQPYPLIFTEGRENVNGGIAGAVKLGLMMDALSQLQSCHSSSNTEPFHTSLMNNIEFTQGDVGRTIFRSGTGLGNDKLKKVWDMKIAPSLAGITANIPPFSQQDMRGSDKKEHFLRYFNNWKKTEKDIAIEEGKSKEYIDNLGEKTYNLTDQSYWHENEKVRSKQFDNQIKDLETRGIVQARPPNVVYTDNTKLTASLASGEVQEGKLYYRKMNMTEYGGLETYEFVKIHKRANGYVYCNIAQTQPSDKQLGCVFLSTDMNSFVKTTDIYLDFKSNFSEAGGILGDIGIAIKDNRNAMTEAISGASFDAGKAMRKGFGDIATGRNDLCEYISRTSNIGPIGSLPGFTALQTQRNELCESISRNSNIGPEIHTKLSELKQQRNDICASISSGSNIGPAIHQKFADLQAQRNILCEDISRTSQIRGT